MVEVWIPYGETEVYANIPAENYLGTVEPREPPQPPSPETLISKAFENPLDGLRLRSLVKPKGRAVVLVDEYGGVLPLRLLAAEILKELEAGGVSREKITFLFGKGLEEAYRMEEALELLGEVCEGCRVGVHNPGDEGLETVEVGSTSRRVKVFLRKDVVEAEVKILIGNVSPHPYAGYSGLGQTLLSAAGSLRTLNRNYTLYGSLEARAGRLEGNPLYSELLEAARMAGLTYAVHTICSWDGVPLKAFAGKPEETFKAAVGFFEESFASTFEGKVKVAVVSPGGKPYDSTFEGAQQALERVVDLVEEGGSIVLTAECSGERMDSGFLLWLNEAKTVEKAERLFRERSERGFHRVLRLRRLQSKFRIYMVSGLPETIASGLLGFKTARSLDDAMRLALRGIGRGSVIVLPSALKTLLKVKV
jgi:nickel-dependent lactate racemase